MLAQVSEFICCVAGPLDTLFGIRPFAAEQPISTVFGGSSGLCTFAPGQPAPEASDAPFGIVTLVPCKSRSSSPVSLVLRCMQAFHIGAQSYHDGVQQLMVNPTSAESNWTIKDQYTADDPIKDSSEEDFSEEESSEEESFTYGIFLRHLLTDSTAGTMCMAYL